MGLRTCRKPCRCCIQYICSPSEVGKSKQTTQGHCLQRSHRTSRQLSQISALEQLLPASLPSSKKQGTECPLSTLPLSAASMTQKLSLHEIVLADSNTAVRVQCLVLTALVEPSQENCAVNRSSILASCLKQQQQPPLQIQYAFALLCPRLQ